ncbi:DUF6862 domain-containing protein [Achromobacter xylosoxidans]
MASCGPGNPESCERAREFSGMSQQRDEELASACVDRASSLCRTAVQLATASGNVVFFDRQGKPLAVPADSPMIQATPDPRDGTWHYTIAASVAEGLAIDSGGGALSGIGSTIRNMFGPTTARVTTNAKIASFSDEAKLVSHFQKHGAEFGVKTSSEYLQVGRDIMQNGDKVLYVYKGEVRTGYVQFMGNSARGDAKFGFVGTNINGAITTIHVESGKNFWKMLNGSSVDKTIRSVR